MPHEQKQYQKPAPVYERRPGECLRETTPTARLPGWSFAPFLFSGFLVALLWEGSGGFFRHHNGAAPRTIHVGEKKVLILGSGFGGTYRSATWLARSTGMKTLTSRWSAMKISFCFPPRFMKRPPEESNPAMWLIPFAGCIAAIVSSSSRRMSPASDLGARKVFTTAGELGYDYLVLALGSIASRPKLETDAPFSSP